MKFEIDAKELLVAIQDIQGRGMYLSGSGVSNSNLSEEVYMVLKDNVLDLWNADNTYALNITLEVIGEVDGEYAGDAKKLAKYLRKFSGSIQFDIGDALSFTDGNRRVSMPSLANHSELTAINRIEGMLRHITYSEELTLPLFGQGKFEGAFILDSSLFNNAITMCEMVGHGIYKLNYTGNNITFSSQTTIANRYEETIELETSIGEAATVEWSGPLHRFFKGDITFYVKDDFPLVLINQNRKLIKAPYVGE